MPNDGGIQMIVLLTTALRDRGLMVKIPDR